MHICLHKNEKTSSSSLIAILDRRVFHKIDDLSNTTPHAYMDTWVISTTYSLTCNASQPFGRCFYQSTGRSVVYNSASRIVCFLFPICTSSSSSSFFFFENSRSALFNMSRLFRLSNLFGYISSGSLNLKITCLSL